MKNAIALLLVILTLASCMAEDRTFWGDATDVGTQVGELLVDKGICEHIQKKCAGHIYAVNPIHGGFDFTVSGVTDPLLLQEIRGILKKKFDETPKMKRLNISFYTGKTKPSGQTVRRYGLISSEKLRR